MTAKALNRTPKAGQAAEKDLAAAQRVLQAEARALQALADALDATFSAAVEIMASVDGRVIVTGMGKSGHVARKIAATMASTGTPAFFVHPAEASHGDLGMIVRGDAVLALSNSGEAPELSDLIAYTRRFSIPLIAMTSRPGSTLATRSDIALILPPAAEACPNGLAPTTSTTMMIALGDALAIALLERRGLTAEDFKTFHPGGKLGKQLATVAELMHGGDTLPLTGEDATIEQAVQIISEKGWGCVGFVDAAGDLTGILTDGDLRRHVGKGLTAKLARDIMTRNPKTTTANALAAEALGVMNEKKITALLVTEGRKPVGLIHIHDLLRAGIA